MSVTVNPVVGTNFPFTGQMGFLAIRRLSRDVLNADAFRFLRCSFCRERRGLVRRNRTAVPPITALSGTPPARRNGVAGPVIAAGSALRTREDTPGVTGRIQGGEGCLLTDEAT
jgi:hypothetical protein